MPRKSKLSKKTKPPGGLAPDSDGESTELDPRASLHAQQTRAEADQIAADLDQTAADVDQTSSDVDQTQSESDQRASDRDQATSDRELGEHPGIAKRRDHDAARTSRIRATAERDTAALIRSRAASERDKQAARRDQIAAKRDAAAEERDRIAAALDREAERSAASLGSLDDTAQKALADAEAARERASADRVRASADRERAAVDRRRAAQDRKQASVELEVAHLDDLTGAYRRGMGEEMLRHEIERAQRADVRLIFAFVDVDGLKAVNDRDGHAAGDDLLRAVVAAIRSKLRPYDPLVRVGGDEFICAITDTDRDGAQARFDEVRQMLGSGSITVGLSEMRRGDTVLEMIKRGDSDMRRIRNGVS
jgi:diguanylate cyclase (GGDEF)-like protein